MHVHLNNISPCPPQSIKSLLSFKPSVPPCKLSIKLIKVRKPETLKTKKFVRKTSRQCVFVCV